MRDKSPAQTYALVFGLVLVAAGVLGFFYETSFATGDATLVERDAVLGLLDVNGWHNVVHVASGVLGLAVVGSYSNARLYALGFGAVYIVVAILGFIYGDGDSIFKLIQEIKQERWREAMALQAEINREQQEALVERELEVLVEGPHEETEHLLVGRHAGQAPEIDGSVILNDLGDFEVSPGDLVRVTVTEAHEYDVVATVTGIVARAPLATKRKLDGGMKLPVFASPR